MSGKKRNINLDARLMQCARLVRNGVCVVDVGTDHAYLAIHLVESKKAVKVIATDLREGPLDNASSNIKKYNCEETIETRLSDGLEEVRSSEVDDIIIAGMGGELIAEIIGSATWLKDRGKHLILQPMTMAEHLRRFLFNEGFRILEEKAVTSANKVYTVMLVAFEGGDIRVSDLYPYIGELEKNLDDAAVQYVKKEIRDLNNKASGCRCQGALDKASELEDVKVKLKKLIEGA